MSTTFILILSSASIGFLHTILGPDHYIPFIVMSKAAKWTRSKTMFITAASGLGHVLSSVILGVIGLSAGIAINQINSAENFRGDLAAWLIISFGLIYFIWGIKRAFKKHGHSHENHGKKLTPWIIFSIFVLGPCEPLIPLLIYPAVTESITVLISVALIFIVVTVSTMMILVAAGIRGLNLIPSSFLERYSHAFAGLMILFCGITIKFMGL